MRLFAIFLGCLQLCLLVAAVSEDEDLFGWQEFQLVPTNAQTAQTIRNYVSAMDLLIADEDHHSFPVSVVAPAEKAAGLQTLLQHLGVKFDILEKDVGGMLLRNKLDNQRRQRAFNSDPATYFAPTSEIYAWFKDLAAANSAVANIEDVGTSYEGRKLIVLQVSNDPKANKPVIFIDAAIHAREWLAPASLNYIVKQFLADIRDSKPEAMALLNKYDWHFVPVVNPDGYDYTFRSSSTRFWRKTRQPYGFAYGADPNRNFDFMFGGVGTSNNPSSDVYHGPRAFSEPETKALSEYLTGIRDRVQKGMYISFHTYGQYWLTPPGYTRVNPPDHTEMVRVGNAAKDAIVAEGGPEFRVGQPANVGLYEAAGGSYDWVKYRLGVTYSFTPELRPRSGSGLSGFAPSPSLIPSSGREMYSAVKAIVNARPSP